MDIVVGIVGAIVAEGDGIQYEFPSLARLFYRILLFYAFYGGSIGITYFEHIGEMLVGIGIDSRYAVLGESFHFN